MRAYWDFKNSPITYDCVTYFAIVFQLMQKARDAHWHLTVCDRGVFRLTSGKDTALSPVEKKRRVEHLFKPLLSCLRGLRSYEVSMDPNAIFGVNFTPPYLASSNVKLFHEGFDPRVIEVPEFAKFISTEFLNIDAPFITFTCRFSRYQPLRNTNFTAFNEVALFIRKKNIVPVLIGDVEQYSEFDPDPSLWMVCEPARQNLHLRLGLYSRALCNVSTGGGAVHPLWYSDIPFISTIRHVADYKEGNSKHWTEIHGTDYGTGYPWFSSRQKFLFGDETSEKILDALSDII
jgi:hypothetical protein